MRRFVLRAVVATVAVLVLAPVASMAQAVRRIEAGVGAAIPLGRFAEIQDAGPLLTLAVEGRAGPGWHVRGEIGRAWFHADERQHPKFADGSWLPFDVSVATFAVQGIYRSGTGPVTVAPLFGFGADYFRSTRVYGLSSSKAFRELYPEVEAGFQVGWRPLGRLLLLTEIRAHAMLTRRGDTELLFESAGSRPGDERGTRWLLFAPMTVGARIRF
jgi:hypothetical protein